MEAPSPSRSTSKARQEPSPRDKEIKNLKNEIRILKQSQTNSITENNPKKHADGLHTGRPDHKQHRNNTCTYLYPKNNGNAIGMQRAIKSKIRYKSDPLWHVINLSKHSFSLDTFKLLNKNLNFVPTPKKYNKKQLDNDAENFFCLIKLRVHFKDINPKLNTDQENLPFQIKNKQKWTHKETHHNVSTFIDLAQNDLNKEKKKKNENSKTQSIQRGTISNGRTCKKKRYYYHQYRQMQCCSNNGRRKIHQRSQPPAIR